MSRERGLYYPDGSFKSESSIRREMAIKGEVPDLRFVTPVKVPRDVNYYLDQATEVAENKREVSPRAENYIELELPRTAIVSVMGDLHFGHPETDNQRIKRELEVIRNTPDSYVILNGDLLDGIFWGGASGGEQTADLTEQRLFLASLFGALKGKVLVGTSGEHDSKWASKSGGDPYFDFSERTGAPYVRGVAELSVNVGQQNYRVVTQHQARGHSMYNKNHPTYREARFELQDADVYVSSHTHQKQISKEAIRKFGRADEIVHISTGSYKGQDNYTDRSGFVPQHDRQKFGASFRLHADRRHVDVEYDILEAHRNWA